MRTQSSELVYFHFDPETGWTGGNDQFAVRFQLEADARFRWVGFWDRKGRAVWEPAVETSSSPIALQVDEQVLDPQTPLRFVREYSYPLRQQGKALVLVFHDLAEQFEIELHLQIFPGQPILRQQVRLKNLGSAPVYVRGNDVLPYAMEIENTDYRVFRVNQWSVLDGGRNFEPLTDRLAQPGDSVKLDTGAGGFQCTWLALRKQNDMGLLAGWEFDGRAEARVERTEQRLELSVDVNSLFHPVAGGEWYEAPAAFLGIFAGDWDEAGYQTQRFAEAALAPPMPDDKFPYLAWDSWGYEKNIDEAKLRAEVDRAAQLGVELFIVDLGWAKAMGDWREDPEKFPSGMRAFSDYVHSKGMKFGLHFVISEAMADSPVLREHPEWACSTSYNYHGAVSLALQHQPVQDWVIAEGVRMIKDYQVDWVLQDGQTMVKECRNEGLSYEPRDWNYMGDLALSRILQEIQRQTPGTVWENCANGGNMMTFRMVRNYVTSITNDASGSLGSRQGVYGASFPFPPRYTDRYMPAVPMTDYHTRSFIFGGPWILMNKLTELKPAEFLFLQNEARLYKELRGLIRQGKVLHISERPLDGRTDALESYDPARDEAVAVVVRDDSSGDQYNLKFRNLFPEHSYAVSFADDRRNYTMTGEQLMNQGVNVTLPERESGEIVFVRPMAAR